MCHGTGQAAGGADAFVDMDRIARTTAALAVAKSWHAVQCTQNHGMVYRGWGRPIPRIAGSRNRGSWYARSHSPVALALTLTLPGIPYLFMEQEFR